MFVVGTYDATGKPNVMTASWGGICCSQPPCVAVSLRKATYSYGNIVARKAFTISIPSEDQVKQADHIGLVSGRKVDKFAETNLTPVRSTLVDAPYVQEFGMVLECKLAYTFELGLHTQFVGEIMDVKVEDWAVGSSGLADIRKIKPLVFTPDTQGYYGIGGFIGRAFSIGQGSAHWEDNVVFGPEPMRVNQPSDQMDEHFEASCLCGGIRLSYSGVIGPANYCHCDDCRRANGSAFNIGVRVERKDLKVNACSEWKSYKYTSESGNEIERCFCGTCGSPIFTLHPAKPEYAWVKAGIITDPSVVKPSFEIWASDKVPWATAAVSQSYREGRTQ